MTEPGEDFAAQEDIAALLRQYTPREAAARERDMLSGRYRIMTNQPLPQFNSSFAAAYNVTDTQNAGAALYALVYDSRVPIRQKNMDVLKEYHNPHMVSLLDHGVADIGIVSEARHVVILEKPSGKTIAQLLAEGRKPLPESMLIGNVLRPLIDILRVFQRSGISHNRINLDNVFWDNDRILLGECVSEPSGYSQDHIFEPIERIQVSPFAKSDYSISSDCYALAVLTLHLALGFRPVASMDKDDLITSLATKGSYNTFVIQWDFSETMQDFFRGLLNDIRRERWDPESIYNWLSGRRFNLITPSLPNEASRGFDFMKTIYYNRKALANAMFQRWQDAYALLADSKVGRWVETSVHKAELGEMIIRIAASSSSDNVRYERQNSELLARTIILLDPIGPLRFKHIAVMIDAMGHMITQAFLSGAQEDMQVLVQMLEGDLPMFWAEHNAGSADYTNVIWKLQRVRNYIRIPTPGFGFERGIYELHPTLPCQSRLVKRYNVTTLNELLAVLDMIAPAQAAQETFMDKHIAGFIAAKIDLAKEITINELDVLPKLSSHPGLVGLKLLLRAQGKIEKFYFPGLSCWVAMKLLSLLGYIHRRDARKTLQKELIDAAGTGMLKNIGGLLFNPEVFVNDYNAFNNAMAMYKQRKRQIAELKNSTMIMRHSRVAGRGMAQIVSYGICLMTVYYTLKVYMHF